VYSWQPALAGNGYIQTVLTSTRKYTDDTSEQVLAINYNTNIYVLNISYLLKVNQYYCITC